MNITTAMNFSSSTSLHTERVTEGRRREEGGVKKEKEKEKARGGKKLSVGGCLCLSPLKQKGQNSGGENKPANKPKICSQSVQ